MLAALILAGVVQNVILVAADYEAPSGITVIEVTDGLAVAPGYLFADGVFTAPAYEAPAPAPKRVSKADFQRLLSPTERYAINALRRDIAALSSADYADPSKSLLVAAEDVLFAFEQPVEFIELDHPDTFAGLTLLRYLDVLTESRVLEIIGG